MTKSKPSKFNGLSRSPFFTYTLHFQGKIKTRHSASLHIKANWIHTSRKPQSFSPILRLDNEGPRQAAAEKNSPSSQFLTYQVDIYGKIEGLHEAFLDRKAISIAFFLWPRAMFKVAGVKKPFSSLYEENFDYSYHTTL